MSKLPDFDVFVVEKLPEDSDSSAKPFWTKIGGAWKTKGDGVNIKLQALPLGDTIVLRRPKPKET